MPEVVMASQISGTRNGVDWPAAGEKMDVPEAEADQLIRAGLAYDPDDERVKHMSGGVVTFSDEILAGAPTAHDRTEGQPDTNLARARALELDERDTREVTRAAAKRLADGPSVERLKKTETGAADPDADTERAADTSKPAGRATTKGN